jgi:hypothetical protein
LINGKVSRFPFDKSQDIQMIGVCGVFVSHREHSISFILTATEYVEPSSDVGARGSAVVEALRNEPGKSRV